MNGEQLRHNLLAFGQFTFTQSAAGKQKLALPYDLLVWATGSAVPRTRVLQVGFHNEYTHDDFGRRLFLGYKLERAIDFF